SYFFLDGLPKPWFVPSIAFGGSIDMGLFLAAASVVLVVGQLVQRHQMRRISEIDAAITQDEHEKGSFLHAL
ncbi:MAG TPA: hypothetical protein DHV65_20445, partial [Ktedonobacter sp.]|nr:hypothetical protein [Ktedonobacter sp.]